jgi:hypothetical protein
VFLSEHESFARYASAQVVVIVVQMVVPDREAALEAAKRARGHVTAAVHFSSSIEKQKQDRHPLRHTLYEPHTRPPSCEHGAHLPGQPWSIRNPRIKERNVGQCITVVIGSTHDMKKNSVRMLRAGRPKKQDFGAANGGRRWRQARCMVWGVVHAGNMHLLRWKPPLSL